MWESAGPCWEVGDKPSSSCLCQSFPEQSPWTTFQDNIPWRQYLQSSKGHGCLRKSSGSLVPAGPNVTNSEIPPFCKMMEMKEKKRRRSRVRQQLVIPKNSSAKKQPVAGQRQGKPVPKGQASQQSQAQAAKPQSCREEAATGGGGIAEKILAEITVTKLVKAKPSRCPEALTFITPVTAVLSASNSEANLLEEPTHAVLRQLPPRLRQQKE
ncbi:uncharacterized protein LOC135317681 [Phalacrocorax carbo]|uniref:uncharacterized protein LOC135317681 n=1 Tax=Phalacrocorax carbo TaxID=9209 RepID=UPI0031197FD9